VEAEKLNDFPKAGKALGPWLLQCLPSEGSKYNVTSAQKYHTWEKIEICKFKRIGCKKIE
jgi:hypothetical protein